MLCKYSNILYVVSWVQKETLWRVRLEIIKNNNFPHYAAGHPSHGIYPLWPVTGYPALECHRLFGSGLPPGVWLIVCHMVSDSGLSRGVRLWPVTWCPALTPHRVIRLLQSIRLWHVICQGVRLWPVTGCPAHVYK